MNPENEVLNDSETTPNTEPDTTPNTEPDTAPNTEPDTLPTTGPTTTTPDTVPTTDSNINTYNEKIEEIVDYIINTPYNTNPNVLRGMLNQLISTITPT